MGVGLQPLEFTECLADSPHFRENLQRHEKELERTSQQIKRLVKEVKDVVQAAKRLGAAQLALATSMEQFEFACIGASMTEDERVISRSLHHFAHLIRSIEDERERMLGRAHEQIIQPLERFRKDHIGAVKEGKKKFDKKTAKFCQTQERTLSLSTRKPESVFQEADAAMEMAERDFCQASLEYVFQLQAVQERKKFELVETLLGFVFGWWTFHHTAHDVHADAEPRVRDLQLRIQRTRSNFEETSKQTESLMKKIMEVRQMSKEQESGEEGSPNAALAGYLFLMEKKAFGTTTWSKQYCTYEKGTRTLALTAYNQINVKTSGGTESVGVCGARLAAEPLERRFCWEAVPGDRERAPLTLQALSEASRGAWLRVLDAVPYVRAPPLPGLAQAESAEGQPQCRLDEAGFAFVRHVIEVLEERGLEEQGLYRVAGVASKVSHLVSLGARGAVGAGALHDALQWETRTLTSALKAFLRALPDPLLTHRLHDQFIQQAKCERGSERARGVLALVRALPAAHRAMLHTVLAHLHNVARKSDKNLMTESNLAVCFGPTVLRAPRETVASILDLKFYNVVAETLIRLAGPEGAASLAPGSPGPVPLPPALRHDISVSDRVSVSAGGAVLGARYSPHHHQLLHHFAPPPPPLAVHRGGAGRSGSSSPDSVSASSYSASPPPAPPAPPHCAPPHPAPPHRAAAALADLRAPLSCRRVRTLYACLGESEGELSFEPNQVITGVSESGEPGWLLGALDGRRGLVPENYVEPLP